MKKIYFSLIILFSLIAISCSQNDRNSPKAELNKAVVEYNGQIMERYQNIKSGLENLNRVLQSGDTVLVNTIHKNLINTVDTSINALQLMTSFQGNDDYRVAALQLFNFYRQILKNEFREFIELQLKSDKNFTSTDSVRSLQIADSIAVKQYHLTEKFRQEQKKLLDQFKEGAVNPGPPQNQE